MPKKTQISLASTLADFFFNLVYHFAIVLVAGNIMTAQSQVLDSKHPLLQTDELHRQTAKSTSL